MPKGVSTKPFDRGGSPANAAALEAQMRRLRSMEDSSAVYAEMRTLADDRAKTGTPPPWAPGWGEYGSTHDPRKRRTGAS